MKNTFLPNNRGGVIWKRIISMLLVMISLLNLLPLNVLAAWDGSGDITGGMNSVSGTTKFYRDNEHNIVGYRFCVKVCNKLEFVVQIKRTVIASHCATSRAKSRRIAAVALETRLRAQWRGNPPKYLGGFHW